MKLPIFPAPRRDARGYVSAATRRAFLGMGAAAAAAWSAAASLPLTGAGTAGGSSGPVNGDPIAVTVLGTSDLVGIPGAGTMTGNGSIIAITFKGLAQGLTLDLTKFLFGGSQPGFDSSGNATSVPFAFTATGDIRKSPVSYVSGLTLAVGDMVLSKAKISASTRIYIVTGSGGTTADANGPVAASTATIDGITYTYLGAMSDTSTTANANWRKRLDSLSGADTTIFLASSHYIPTTANGFSCTIGAGAYGTSNASRVGIVAFTNNSTRLALKPQVTMVTPSRQYVTDNIRLECTAVHPSMQSSRTLALLRWKIYNSVGVYTGVSVDCTSMTSSTVATTAQGGPPVPVFGTTLSTVTAGLADGVYYARLEAYPFWGRSWISGTDGLGHLTATTAQTQPANTPFEIMFRKDTAGAFPPVYATVNGTGGTVGGILAGNDTTGTAAASSATADLLPFATIAAAFTTATRGAVAKNSSLNGHNTGGNVIINVVGTAAAPYSDGLGGTGMQTPAIGDIWTIIRRHPTATSGAADVVIGASATTGKKTLPLRCWVEDVTIAGSAAASAIDMQSSNTPGDFPAELVFHRCIITTSAAVKPISRAALTTYLNCSMTAVGATLANDNVNTGINLVAGCKMDGMSAAALNALGNLWVNAAVPAVPIFADWFEGQGVATGPVTSIWMANVWPSCTGAVRVGNYALTRGFSFVQNLIELYSGSGGTVKGGELCADNVQIDMPEINDFYNTSAGDGANIGYNEVGAVSYNKVGLTRYNYRADDNRKGQMYDATLAVGARVGNMGHRYMTGSGYNYIYGFGSFDGLPSPANIRCEAKAANDIYGSGAGEFTSDQSKSGTSSGSASANINANYQPTHTSKGRIIPAGMQGLPFDGAGTTRDNASGFGCVGFLEAA